MKDKEFKLRITKLWATPFPITEFTYLLKEKNDKQKRQLLSLLGLQLKAPQNKPFPTNGLLQLVRKRINNPNEKLLVLQGVILSILDIYEENDSVTEEQLLDLEEEKTIKYGPWHYYWSLLCYPDPSEKIDERLSALRDKLIKREVDIKYVEQHNSTFETTRPNNKGNEIASLERDRRIKAELEISRLDKEFRKLEASYLSFVEENEKYKTQSRDYKVAAERLQEELDDIRKSARQMQWDKKQANNQIVELQNVIKYNEMLLAATVEQFEQKIQESPTSVLEDKESSLSELSEIIEQLIEGIYQKTFELSDQLKGSSLSKISQESIRNQIIQSHMLINQLDHYNDKYLINKSEIIHQHSDDYLNHNERKFIQKPVDNLELNYSRNSYGRDSLHLREEPSHDVAGKSTGTFYRKDHGGYIVLEDGQKFQITESMVNAIGLEHEAEVECEPKPRENGSIHQQIKILFQGDNSLAPIKQYLGYIELGPFHTFYCIDFHNKENKYPVHEKDIQIQQPNDGDPCIFNVSLEGTYARLSKLFRNVEEANAEREKASPKRSSERNDKSERVREPFLTGCKVAVIGGQAKWFKSVVEETGAEFVHENGEHPERIFAELMKSNVLFKLITATSHGAIWAGVDIAKENGIPHFLIEGSKSNLRAQLWEKRHLIRRTKET